MFPHYVAWVYMCWSCRHREWATLQPSEIPDVRGVITRVTCIGKHMISPPVSRREHEGKFPLIYGR